MNWMVLLNLPGLVQHVWLLMYRPSKYRLFHFCCAISVISVICTVDLCCLTCEVVLSMEESTQQSLSRLYNWNLCSREGASNDKDLLEEKELACCVIANDSLYSRDTTALALTAIRQCFTIDTITSESNALFLQRNIYTNLVSRLYIFHIWFACFDCWFNYMSDDV